MLIEKKQFNKGITIHMGIEDSDHMGEIIVIFMLTVWTSDKREPIAQLLLFPFVMLAHSDCPRIGDFSSTNSHASTNPLVTFNSKFTQA